VGGITRGITWGMTEQLTVYIQSLALKSAGLSMAERATGMLPHTTLAKLALLPAENLANQKLQA